MKTPFVEPYDLGVILKRLMQSLFFSIGGLEYVGHF